MRRSIYLMFALLAACSPPGNSNQSSSRVNEDAMLAAIKKQIPGRSDYPELHEKIRALAKQGGAFIRHCRFGVESLKADRLVREVTKDRPDPYLLTSDKDGAHFARYEMPSDADQSLASSIWALAEVRYEVEYAPEKEYKDWDKRPDFNILIDRDEGSYAEKIRATSALWDAATKFDAHSIYLFLPGPDGNPAYLVIRRPEKTGRRLRKRRDGPPKTQPRQAPHHDPARTGSNRRANLADHLVLGHARQLR